jgi:outer membrane biosynthesis protein TonB
LAGLLFLPSLTAKVVAFRQDGQSRNEEWKVECVASREGRPVIKLRLYPLNGAIIKMPKPTYPVEAKKKAISGEVKVEVLIDLNTGIIERAEIQSGETLLREAVKKVVCQARFQPTDDVNAKASGYLVYKFAPSRKSASR